MMSWIAQATQSNGGSGGMGTWTYAQWGAFLTAAGIFIGGPLTVFATMIFNRIEKIAIIANSAKTDAAVATVTANSADAKSTRNADRIIDLAKSQPSPSQALAPLLAATPESIRQAFRENASDAEANIRQFQGLTQATQGGTPPPAR